MSFGVGDYWVSIKTLPPIFPIEKLPVSCYNKAIKMKKPSLYLFCILLAARSFAVELPEGYASVEVPSQGVGIERPARSLYIEGTAEDGDNKAFFMYSFRVEAYKMDIKVTDCRYTALFTLRFDVQSHTDENDPSLNYIIHIFLYNNETGAELVSFGWTFADLEAMYGEQNEFLFYTAVALIPGIVREDLIVREELMVVYVPVRDNRWQHNWLYIRLSVDYPIAFYVLQPTGLLAGQAVYNLGPTGNVENFDHIEHLITPRPGMTLGLELQFLRFLSMELNFQLNFGDPRSNTFAGMAAGARLMPVLRTNTFMIQPYAAAIRVINSSPQFYRFPRFAVGGGAQISVRGPGNGAFFVDINYMHFLGSVFRYNPYMAFAPNPPVIHYNRFVVGLGIGYKFGLLER